MKKYTAEELIIKYVKGECTPEEKILVESGFLQELKTNKENIPEGEVEDAVQRMSAAITEQIIAQQSKRKRYFSFIKLSVAASLLLVAGVAWYFNKDRRAVSDTPQSSYVSDVKPGGNKAYLTLENGKKITLDDAANGKLAEQSGIIITKSKDGQLIYTVADKGAGTKNGELLYNTIETPRSGQYQINLPDGSEVWLNAASTLTYPVRFTGSERKVKLTGEAYFEVAHNRFMPFRVESNNQVVEVLGTHFNINAYSDEPVIRTTLLEGSVYVKSNNTAGFKGQYLEPGQETLLGADGIRVQNADIESATAWKNGDFIFKGESLASIMRKVSKWYDVDVSYEQEMDENLIFSGFVSRSRNLSAILKTMELTGKVHFKIEGRRVTIMR